MDMRSTRHIRFVIAFGISLLAGASALWAKLPLTTCILITADLCFALYLLLELRLSATLAPQLLHHRATADDEGVPLIVLLAVASVAVSLTAIFNVIGAQTRDPLTLGLALISIPLGWAVLHTMAAFHYAYLYYAPAKAGGINFPGTETPTVSDFLYFAFTIGMTAQVSDATIDTSAMRKAVLIHAIGSFFYNTGILALAVSAAIN